MAATYLVTGGCGFIGSHLVEALLDRGDVVRVLDDLSVGRADAVPPAAELIVGDVADPAVVAKAMAGVDFCFHLAAIASVVRANEDWTATHRTNLGGAVAVFEAAARQSPPVPVVYASSAAVYGVPASDSLFESAACRPLTAYGADKLGAEQHALVGGLVHRLPTIGFRFFNVYGPRQDPSGPYAGVISVFADRLERGLPITVFGDGLQTRDFIYVADVVEHLLAAPAYATPDSPVFNVCTGRETTVLELAGLISRTLGHHPSIIYNSARVGDIRRSCGCPKAAAARFGFAARTILDDGIARLMAWRRI